MTRPKRHHYVPQFALRQFAPDTKPQHVWTFDKRSESVRLQAIRDCAVESRFYDHIRLDEYGVDLEARLAGFEDAASRVIQAIVAAKSLRMLEQVEREYVVGYALVQLFRTRASREFAKQGARMLGVEIDEEMAKQASLASLLRDFDRYRECLANHIVTLRVAHACDRFILGDSVTLLTCPKGSPKDSLKVLLPNSTLIVPLSSSCCIMMFSGVRERELAEAGNWYRPDIRVLTEAQPALLGDVPSVNKLSVIASHRFLFASSDCFADVREILSLEPNARGGPIGGWDEFDSRVGV